MKTYIEKKLPQEISYNYVKAHHKYLSIEANIAIEKQ